MDKRTGRLNPAVNAKAPITVQLLNRAATHPAVLAFAEREGYGVRAGVAATDYAVAHFLDMSPQMISMWRTTDRGMSPDKLMEICAALDLSTAETHEWLCDLRIEHARSPIQKAAWLRHKERVVKNLTAVILPFLLWLPTDVEALAAQAERTPDGAPYKYYVKRLLSWLRRLAAAARPPSQAAYAAV